LRRTGSLPSELRADGDDPPLEERDLDIAAGADEKASAASDIAA
jgi:hypothetical protein